MHTRFAEYLHRHLEAILNNVKVLIAALPSVDVNPVLMEKKKFIMKQLLDKNFIARLLTIKQTYEMISKLEKVAQYETFGAFDYVSLVSYFKANLSNATHLDDCIVHVLSTGT